MDFQYRESVKAFHDVPEEGVFVFNGNSISKARKFTTAGAKEIILWGGAYLNCGESHASSFIYNNSKTLKHLTYFPGRTKGGCMIRPLYFKGDRGGKVLFPMLESISLCIHTGVGDLYGWGYIAPELNTINLLIDRNHNLSWHADWPYVHGVPSKLLHNYPKLDQIRVFIAAENDTENRKKDLWAVLNTPKKCSWDIKRLLLIGAIKEDSSTCILATLPLELIALIMGFLDEDWSIELVNTLYHKENEQLQSSFKESFFHFDEKLQRKSRW